MPPDRGRAPKACAACRKIKTRCNESDATGKPATGDRLQQPCSLDSRTLGHNDNYQGPMADRHEANSSSDDRLSRLEQTVFALVERLDRGASQSPRMGTIGIQDAVKFASQQLAPPPTPSRIPMFLIRDVASQAGVRPQGPLMSGIVYARLPKATTAVEALEGITNKTTIV